MERKATKMEVGSIYSGFKLLSIKDLKEINSENYLFEHIKSGAKLMFLKNDDDNKVFSIAFRTPPENSTGVAHILEHSVLCGSRKFPVKEPFVELLKGSLNTFLNAMTFADKTIYPVASRNDKDFSNLMDVYLDAVFFPNIYIHKEIFMQEGWHYELENSKDEITYKGVVYNEMKGAFSSPDSILYRKSEESLYPDTPYGFESGGEPDCIPDLGYEEFLNFHKKFYHPSNSYIYLYGNLNIEEKLKFIDEEYLNIFNRAEINSKIVKQNTFDKMREVEVEYPIGDTEKLEDKTNYSMNFCIGKSDESELNLAFEILEYILLETPSSPLKKALIDEKLGKDVYGMFEDGIAQTFMSIIIKNSNEGEKERFIKIVDDTLNNLVKNGIDKKLIEASINIREFNLREAQFQGYPKGLVYHIKSMGTWLYDCDPLLNLKYENSIKNIKTALTTNYFENLIEKHLLKNNHKSLVTVKPKKGLAELKAEDIKKELKLYKEKLSSVEIDNLVSETKKLQERQNTPDSIDDINKIPLLSIEDINPNTDELPLVVKNREKLFHPVFTNKIYYMNLYFNSDVVKEELIPYVSLLAAMIGEVSTKNYSYGDLSNEVNINTGGITFYASAYAKGGDDSTYYPRFVVKSKAMVDKLPKLMELISEELMNSKFDDKKKMKEIIEELKSRLEMVMIDRGHVIASNRVVSYYSQIGKYLDLCSGLSFYNFLCDLDKNYENKWTELQTILSLITKSIFNKDNMLVSITCDESDYANFDKNLHILENSLGSNNVESIKYKFELDRLNEGLMTSAKVQYVAKSFNFKELGYEYSGSLLVMKTISGYDYLWNKVRVQGGAYGCFMSLDRNGKLIIVSYRDPNLSETLKIYDDIEEYFSSFQADEREMTKNIIGTISKLDQPLTPANKGEYAAEFYIRNITFETRQRERSQVLKTKVQDIKNVSSMFKAGMKENYICVLGNEQKIKENADLFNNLVNLFE